MSYGRANGSAGGLTITGVETTLLDLPLIRPHAVAVGRIEVQGVLLVRLRTRDGIVGVGEGVVPGGPWWSGESVEGMQAMVQRYLAPVLIGQDALRVGFLGHELDRLINGARFAKAAVEMALWDAAGKALDRPVHQLLGGRHRTRLPVTWAIGAEPAAAVVAEADEVLDSGRHTAFKLKAGSMDPEDDVARLIEVAGCVGDRARLAVDLNGTWDEPTARRWLPALVDAGIMLIEQPVPGWNVAAMARLRSRTGAALMADESLCTPSDAVRLVAEHAADVLSLKVAKSGGIGAVQRIGIIAEAAGLACYGGTTIETSVGTAAALQVFCACPALTAGTELFGPELLADDIVETPLSCVAGHLELGGGPGLGVTLDEDKVAKYARR